MAFTHNTLAQRVILGSGLAARPIADEVARLGGKRAMVIAGEHDAALVDRVTACLDVALRWGLVRQHVPLDLARQARAAAQEAGVDLIVCVGGGSTTGLAKAVAMEVDVRIIAVPTTHAGSEATDVWGLTYEGVKTTGSDSRVLPATVVYDAELTTSLPIDLTVASGLNGLAHCVDSLWAPRTDPINLAMALEGARALTLGLRSVVAEPADLTGREQCLYGAYLAAVAFASGMHYKICHVLGGATACRTRRCTPWCCPMCWLTTPQPFLPRWGVLRWNWVPHLPKSTTSRRSCGRRPAALRSRLGAPRSLAEIGLELPDAAAYCLTKIPESIPVPVTDAALTALLRAAWADEAPAVNH